MLGLTQPVFKAEPQCSKLVFWGICWFRNEWKTAKKVFHEFKWSCLSLDSGRN